MSHLTDFITHFGNVIELDFPKWDTPRATEILLRHPGWKEYQPHKKGYNRYGLSVTSLDGGFSGDPDLYSLPEYRKLYGKSYSEAEFKSRTNVVDFIPELSQLLDFFEPALGRVHFLKLNKGGFFPPHRDNGLFTDVDSYRILVPIHGFGINDMKWIQEEHVLNLREGTTYFINTTRAHSLFSFVDNCIMLVLNVMTDKQVLEKMVKKVVPV
jgi:hypothetical protein